MRYKHPYYVSYTPINSAVYLYMYQAAELAQQSLSSLINFLKILSSAYKIGNRLPMVVITISFCSTSQEYINYEMIHDITRCSSGDQLSKSSSFFTMSVIMFVVRKRDIQLHLLTRNVCLLMLAYRFVSKDCLRPPFHQMLQLLNLVTAA